MGDIKFICNLISPEDLAVIPDSEWLIASGNQEGGMLHLVNIRDKSTSVLYPNTELREQLDPIAYPTCPGPITGRSTSGESPTSSSIRGFTRSITSRPTIPTFDDSTVFSAWYRGEDAPPGNNGPRMTPGGFKPFEHCWSLPEAFDLHAQIGRKEIAARTQPNLFDLAVAVFSALAGAYSMIRGREGTIVGVAIATALMPPLAVLGYGIGVLQIRFALGALLLF